jgi:hypothetical protein
VKAGVDFPYYYWQLANGEAVSAPTDYETGIGTHRIGGEFMYLLSVANPPGDAFVDPPHLTAAVRDVLESVSRQPHFDYLEYDDPCPFGRDLTSWVTRETRKTAKTLSARFLG